MNYNGQRSKHQGDLNWTSRRLSRDFTKHKLDKIVAGREEKKRYPARQCKVHAAHKKRSETRYICKSCVLLHEGSWFEK